MKNKLKNKLKHNFFSNIPRKKLIKLEKTDNCLIFKIISSEKKYSRFYLIKEKIYQVLEKDELVIDKDIFSFCRIYRADHKNLICFEFTLLEGTTGSEVKGEIVYVNLNLIDFYMFVYGDKTETTLLEQIEPDYKTKIVFSSPAKQTLKQIISNKTLRKKFGKQICSRFFSGAYPKVEFYPDFVDYSFGFSIYNSEGKFVYNGGLILHKDRKELGNLKKARYSVHT